MHSTSSSEISPSGVTSLWPIPSFFLSISRFVSDYHYSDSTTTVKKMPRLPRATCCRVV